MSLELLMLGDLPAAQLAERARLADERFYREVYAVLAQVASATRRVRLGPCVNDPLTRHPGLTAMAIAALDEISDGRAVLGLGGGVSGLLRGAPAARQPWSRRRAARSSALPRPLAHGRAEDRIPQRVSR